MNEKVSLKQLENQIFETCGQKIMLNKDLAKLYGVETKVLIQAVKRNSEIPLFQKSYFLQPKRLNLLDFKNLSKTGDLLN